MIVHSFDLFDTCIARMHAYPRDLFFDLGLRLAPASSSDRARKRFARRFQRARIRAEKIANWHARRVERDHADIYAIYRNLGWLMLIDHAPEELVAAEIGLEEESLYPVDETMAHIGQLREQGRRIIFISDMYLPSALLGPLLLRMGVMQEGDGLYVSCDAGASKHTGKLFQRVLTQENLTGADVLHTGDNLHADIRMAEAYGIRTHHFTATHFLGREITIAGPRTPRSLGASWQVAFSRRCRLATRHALGTESTHPLDGVIFGVIVPFLLAYVLWVLDDARKRGIQRLYFVARDGEILLKIAKALKPQGIDLRYLYGSRRAWLPAVASPECEFWRNTLAVPGQKNAPRDIVDRTGLDALQQQAVRTALALSETEWTRSLSSDEAQFFVDTLLSQPQASRLILASAKVKRETALRYFEQEGMLDGDTWALVDAGWTLNAQAALRQIIHTGVSGLLTQGYYIGLSADYLPFEMAGDAFPFVARDSIFSRRRVVVEHCFLPSMQPSTLGYDAARETILPLLGPAADGAEHTTYIRRLHEAAHEVATLLSSRSELQAALCTHSASVIDIAGAFLRSPAPDEVEVIAKLPVWPDMRQDVALQHRLARPMSMTDCLNVLARSSIPEKSFALPARVWLEGSLAISPRKVKMAFSPVFLIHRILQHLK